MDSNRTLPKEAPGKLPILGHLTLFRKDPYKFLQKNCSEMGNIFSFQLLNRNFYVLNHPDLIKHVLIVNAKNYSRKSSYHFLEEMLGQGMLTTEGELWRKRRRIAQPAFSKESLSKLVEQIEGSIIDFISKYNVDNKSIFDLDYEMNHLTLSVLTNSIIKTELNDKFNLVKENLFFALQYLTTNRFKAIKWTKNLPSITKYKGQRGIKILKSIVLEIIESRRSSTITHTDLLAMLMASKDEETGESLTNNELLDEVMTMFVAGHDTTSVVLTWTLYLLARNPEIEEKLSAEIEANYKDEPLTIDALKLNPFLRMTIQESMRLYPPVWSFGRKAINDDYIDGYFVPKGTSCTMPALFVHRNPLFWEKPNEFYPEHFLPEKVKERDNLAYFPFSAGQHRCIGEHYAIMEIQIALIHLLKNFKVILQSQKEITPLMLITLKPKEPVLFYFQKRK
jgi:cytochrome P450